MQYRKKNVPPLQRVKTVTKSGKKRKSETEKERDSKTGWKKRLSVGKGETTGTTHSCHHSVIQEDLGAVTLLLSSCHLFNLTELLKDVLF